MKRVIAIHQPEHMPWAGFFQKMSQCDTFVVLDSVQFTKNNWQNRNRFINHTGSIYWLTIPVRLKHHTQKTFREIEIEQDQKWRKKYLNSLRTDYGSFPYFCDYFPSIEEIMSRKHERLLDLNMAFICYFRKLLKIDNQIIFASSLGATGKKTSLLIDICHRIGGTSYISGIGGKAYLDSGLFEKNGIFLEFSSFKPNLKISGNFYEGVSILDHLFRNGTQKVREYVLN